MLYVITGLIVLAASFLFSMLGLGGALLYVPIMKWAGFPVKEVAIPLGLLLNCLTTSIALIAFARNKLVDWKGGGAMTLAAFIFAPIGAISSDYVPTTIILILFSIVVIIVATRMIFSSKQPEPKGKISFKKRAIIGALVGSLAGFLAGLLGIGGGFLMAPLLMWMGYTTKQAAGTSAFAVTFSSFSGFLGHISQGHFNLTLTIVLGTAVIIGALIGSNFMVAKANTARIKQVFAIVLYAIAIKLIIGAIY